MKFTYVMSSLKGKKPLGLEIFDRCKRALMDREITDNALEFIERHVSGRKLFFAFVSCTQTHEPVDSHPDFYGSTGNGSFANVVAQTDVCVGELLERIDGLGIRDNSILIFTSDNRGEVLHVRLVPQVLAGVEYALRLKAH